LKTESLTEKVIETVSDVVSSDIAVPAPPGPPVTAHAETAGLLASDCIEAQVLPLLSLTAEMTPAPGSLLPTTRPSPADIAAVTGIVKAVPVAFEDSTPTTYGVV
jgi:hypothetical protein